MRKVEKETIIEQLKDCYNKHGFVNRRVFNEDDDYCSGKTVYNKFGSFSDACEQAGVPHCDKPQSTDKEEITCLQCGQTRMVYPYRAKNFENNTSEKCKYCMNKKKTVLCDWCGESIVKHNYQVSSQENLFCDRDCLGSWRSENIVGEQHPQYDGGTIRKMGRNWSSVRESAIQRDDEQCIECGMSRSEHTERFNRDLNVHHIVPRKTFIEREDRSIDDANELDNLQTLCIPCHQRKEVSQ